MHLVGEEGRISVARITRCPRTDGPRRGTTAETDGRCFTLSRAIFDLIEDRAW